MSTQQPRFAAQQKVSPFGNDHSDTLLDQSQPWLTETPNDLPRIVTIRILGSLIHLLLNEEGIKAD